MATVSIPTRCVMPPPITWTTADEVALIRKMFLAGNIKALRQYEHNALNRVWHGAGMEIDPAIVIWEAQDCIAELMRQHQQQHQHQQEPRLRHPR